MSKPYRTRVIVFPSSKVVHVPGFTWPTQCKSGFHYGFKPALIQLRLLRPSLIRRCRRCDWSEYR